MHYVAKVMSQLLVSIMFVFGLSCISVFVNWLEWWTTVSVITTISLIHQYSIPVAQRLYRKRCWNILKTWDVVGIFKALSLFWLMWNFSQYYKAMITYLSHQTNMMLPSIDSWPQKLAWLLTSKNASKHLNTTVDWKKIE